MPRRLKNIFSPAVKAGDIWMIDFVRWSLVARNEDLEKLTKALE